VEWLCVSFCASERVQVKVGSGALHSAAHALSVRACMHASDTVLMECMYTCSIVYGLDWIGLD
jgi:hypothetical protein